MKKCKIKKWATGKNFCVWFCGPLNRCKARTFCLLWRSGRDLPAGRQRSAQECEEQNQGRQKKSERQPDRVQADQPRLSRHLFPRKHPRTILREIQRDCSVFRVPFEGRFKSAPAILTHLPVSSDIGTADSAGSSFWLLVHSEQCNRRRSLANWRLCLSR
jgi:hypothetical protein